MSEENTTEKRKSSFGWLLTCFIFFVLSLPIFYLTSHTEGMMSLVLLALGFLLISFGMVISIFVKS